MSTGAADVDPAAIEQVARALVRYGEAEEAVARTVREGQRRASDAVARETARRTNELSHARAVLDACLSHEDADCSAPARAVQAAEVRVQQAHQASRMLNAAAGRFDPAMARHTANVASLVEAGRRHLGRNAADLGTYLGAGGGAAGGGAGGSSGNGSSGAASVAGPGGLAVPAGFPEGYAMVPLSQIDVSDSTVTDGENSFHSDTSPADLDWGIDALHEVVMPAMAMGKGADFFAERDQRDPAGPLYGTRSYHDTYTGYFGKDNAISLSRNPDGSYHVANGHHRIWLAARRGETAVPARLDP